MCYCRCGESELSKDDSHQSFDGTTSEHSKVVEQAKDESRFSYDCSNDAVAKNLSGGPTNTSRSNASPSKNANGNASNLTELESAQWKNVFPSYLQSRDDESDGENDELVQVIMRDWQLAFTYRLFSSLFSNSNDYQLFFFFSASCCWSSILKCMYWIS